MFKRKAYEKLLRWKRDYSNGYAALLEGPRRVGKSTIAKHFAEEEYDSSIIIDFANITSDMLAVFDDVAILSSTASADRYNAHTGKVGYRVR